MWNDIVQAIWLKITPVVITKWSLEKIQLLNGNDGKDAYEERYWKMLDIPSFHLVAPVCSTPVHKVIVCQAEDQKEEATSHFESLAG